MHLSVYKVQEQALPGERDCFHRQQQGLRPRLPSVPKVHQLELFVQARHCLHDRGLFLRPLIGPASGRGLYSLPMLCPV